jgi:hypothetical protein
MVPQHELAIEVLTVQGWYRGYIILPAGGRLLDYLNTKPDMIGLTGLTDPAGAHHASVVINTEHVLAIRLQGEE